MRGDICGYNINGGYSAYETESLYHSCSSCGGGYYHSSGTEGKSGITEGENLSVQIPSINCILGDKLTAFAPHTTGIPLGIGKDLEVIKQMYDCATLFQAMNDFSEVKAVYGNVVQKELGYRGLSLHQEDVLVDTIKSCLCIMGRGSINKDEYPAYADGITRIQGHIFSGTFNGEWAGVRAASVLYLASSILTAQQYCSPDLIVTDVSVEMNKLQHIRRIKYIQKIDQVAFKCITGAYQLLEKKISIWIDTCLYGKYPEKNMLSNSCLSFW